MGALVQYFLLDQMTSLSKKVHVNCHIVVKEDEKLGEVVDNEENEE